MGQIVLRVLEAGKNFRIQIMVNLLGMIVRRYVGRGGGHHKSNF